MSKEPNKIDFVEFPAQNIQDVASTKRFYGEVFGWAFKDWGDDYIDTSSSGLACGFNADSQHKSRKPLVVIYTENIDLAMSRVLQAGGTITKEIFSFPGGRRFHFTDPASNELAIWSDK